MTAFIADQVLFDGIRQPRHLPAVDHYAGRERYMYKALQVQAELNGACDITLDFEDGSASGHEREQAQLVAAVLAEANTRRGRVGIRIHDATSPFWQMQCEHSIVAGIEPPAYITLPKVTGLDQVEAVCRYIGRLSEAVGLPQTIPLHVMVEDPGVLAELQQIVRLPQVECVSLGLLDYVSSFAGALPMSLIESPNEFSSPIINDVKVRIAKACQIHGKVASHSLCSELDNVEVIAAHAATAFNVFGFRRMWSIHPNQIQPILQAARPAQSLIAQAAELLVRARASGWAPIRHRDQLHDRASYRYYWSVLKAAHLAAAPIPEYAAPLFVSSTGEQGATYAS